MVPHPTTKESRRCLTSLCEMGRGVSNVVWPQLVVSGNMFLFVCSNDQILTEHSSYFALSLVASASWAECSTRRPNGEWVKNTEWTVRRFLLSLHVIAAMNDAVCISFILQWPTKDRVSARIMWKRIINGYSTNRKKVGAILFRRWSPTLLLRNPDAA